MMHTKQVNFATELVLSLIENKFDEWIREKFHKILSNTDPYTSLAISNFDIEEIHMDANVERKFILLGTKIEARMQRFSKNLLGYFITNTHFKEVTERDGTYCVVTVMLSNKNPDEFADVKIFFKKDEQYRGALTTLHEGLLHYQSSNGEAYYPLKVA